MPCAVEQSKVTAELEFWRELYARAGHERFAEIRRADFVDYARNFPEIHWQGGLGLDLGCGPWSVFENAHKMVVGVDLLLPEYAFVQPPPNTVAYQAQDGEDLNFNDARFDWAWAVNCIDHTPNPERMLSEVRRVLKPGGKFYFAVWFDPQLYAPHYRLWNRATVDAYLKDFKLLRGTEEWWAEHRKYRYWGLYE